LAGAVSPAKWRLDVDKALAMIPWSISPLAHSNNVPTIDLTM